MDIICIELVHLTALHYLGIPHRKSGCGHLVLRRDGNGYIVNTEITVEFGGSVILMEVPSFLLESSSAGRLVDAYFRKPLAGHDEVTGGPHPGEYFRQLDLELKPHRNT